MSEAQKPQTQFRLVLGAEAISALDSAVATVNQGFTAGAVSKSDLATYLFKNLIRFLSKSEIAKIRNEFFDEQTALNHLLRESSETGKLPEELRKILKDQFRIALQGIASDKS